jgi:hypothetical protein
MSPQRVIRKVRDRHFGPVIVASCVGFLAAFVFGSFALSGRTDNIDTVIRDLQQITYHECVANETQDNVIVAQLKAAKRRAIASLPAGSPELRYQLQVLDDGILALEPPHEADCQPPEGTSP